MNNLNDLVNLVYIWIHMFMSVTSPGSANQQMPFIGQ